MMSSTFLCRGMNFAAKTRKAAMCGIAASRNLDYDGLHMCRSPVRAMGHTAATTGENLHRAMIRVNGGKRKVELAEARIAVIHRKRHLRQVVSEGSRQVPEIRLNSFDRGRWKERTLAKKRRIYARSRRSSPKNRVRSQGAVSSCALPCSARIARGCAYGD